MTAKEKQEFLKKQLDLLANAAESAYNCGFYGDISEIMKIILEVFDRITTA